MFKFQSLLEKEKFLPKTKRNILRLAALIYDPLGLISPITTRVKTMFQILCKDTLEWDDEIPDSVRKYMNRVTEIIG